MVREQEVLPTYAHRRIDADKAGGLPQDERRRRRTARPLLAAALLGLAAIAAWWFWTHRTPPGTVLPLTLYGNVEIRQVDLSFGVEGPLARVLVDEGDRVEIDQTLAMLEQESFRYAEAGAAAQLASAEARLAELVAGSRLQEIERARAAVASAEAALTNADLNLKRAEDLASHNFTAQQTLDAARLIHRTADANLRQAHAELALRVEGTRVEQIDQQRADVESRRANLQLQSYRLERSVLKAPGRGVVLTRIREPGAVVMANTPVLTVAVIDPVWIRAYVDEPHLGRLAPGTKVDIETDATPRKTYVGRVGYVSPTAEFTPKSVETPELRTDLVYRVRILVDNPDGALRQGMPATLTVAAPPHASDHDPASGSH
jgi:HlyD family secretion protein